MKTNIIFIITWIFGYLLPIAEANAQCRTVQWPEDKAQAEECVVFWTDAIKTKKYRKATPYIGWMLNNAPQWNLKLYVDAVKVYSNLADAEEDQTRRQELVDSILLICDLRIKNCGDRVNVLNRKAFYSLKYNIKSKEKLPDVLALYDSVYAISGTQVMNINLKGYITAVYANWIQLKNLSEDDVLSRYDKLIQVIDTKLKQAKKKEKQSEVDKLNKMREDVDKTLVKMVTIDCDFVRRKLGPRFKENPDEISLAKRIFLYMTKDGCIDDPLWIQAAETVHKNDPDYGLAINIAKVYAKNKNVTRAQYFVKEAVRIGSTKKQKEEAFLFHGDLLASLGRKSEARKIYREAISANSNSTEGYIKIGDLYMNSFSDCAKKQSMAEDRLVYIAAYNMYARSGNRKKMTLAKQQFPSNTEMFELNWREGESKSISCWIGETVVLRSRGKE